MNGCVAMRALQASVDAGALCFDVTDGTGSRRATTRNSNRNPRKTIPAPTLRPIADAVARQLGSWRFLIIQSCLLAVWMSLNIAELLFKPFDPYPFILLNLVLSFQAAYAAPVLLMSANRQADKDRLAARSASLVGQRAEEENRAILRHLEAQDELLIVLLRSLKAIESRILQTVDHVDEETVKHHQDALQQAHRDDDHAALEPQ